MILVTGATGRVGYRLMEALADARADATAMVRVEAKAADLPGTGRHVVATLDDPPPAQALREFDRIFLLSPEIEEQAELETTFLDAVAAAGHRPHIVKMCTDGFQDPGCEVRFAHAHRQVALHLETLGLPVTLLVPTLYMDDLIPLSASIRESGTLTAPAGHGSVAWVAAADVAAAAARVLTSPGDEDKVYVLTGPEKLTGHQVAERYSEVFAQQVDYADRAPELARKDLLAVGVDPWVADGMQERFAWVRAGGAAAVTDTVRELTGTAARPLVEWLGDSREYFLT